MTACGEAWYHAWSEERMGCAASSSRRYVRPKGEVLASASPGQHQPGLQSSTATVLHYCKTHTCRLHRSVEVHRDEYLVEVAHGGGGEAAVPHSWRGEEVKTDNKVMLLLMEHDATCSAFKLDIMPFH